MRHVMSKWVVGLAVVAACLGSAPAMACGGLFNGGCSPCGGAGYASPCSGYGYGGGYSVAPYERLADPTPVTRQYFYANQGPTFSGPGAFAPAPTYQETAIGWRGYPRYDGGPYASPIDHYSYARPGYAVPLVYSYRSHSGYRRGHGFARRSYVSHVGYRARPYNPRVMYAPRHGYPHAHRAY
jgi:hypothetical protein